MKIYQSTGNGHDTAHLGENFRFKNIKSFVSSAAGIDVDGRREMIKHMIPCLEKSIKRFIAFAKALPGFKDIPIEDQIALIKGWSRHSSRCLPLVHSPHPCSVRTAYVDISTEYSQPMIITVFCYSGIPYVTHRNICFQSAHSD